MEFTLRQGRSLEARLRGLTIGNQIIEVRAYDVDVAEDDIQDGIDNLEDEIRHKVALNEIRHIIKDLINRKNMECGVSELLNTRERLYESKRILETLGQVDTTERQLEAIGACDDDSRKVSVVRDYHYDDVCGELYGTIDEDIRELQEKLSTLNNEVTIDLPLDNAVYLQGNGII